MKNRIFFFVIMLLLAGSGWRCKKNAANNNKWTGKLVVWADCDHFVVQLQSGPIPDSGVLTRSWTDTATDSSFTNVFTVKDVCTFAQANLKQGDVFSFTLNGAAPVETCMTCDVMPSFPLPPASNIVTNIQADTHH